MLGNTPTDVFFSRPQNCAFHDLTQGKVMPKGLSSLLGLSHSFIPTPPSTMPMEDVEATLDRFERDMQLKVYFADEPMDANPPPLYLKSNWRPNPGEIPREVDRRLFNFFRAVKSIFAVQKGRSNLSPTQLRLLRWARTQADYIIAKTDKNLGPCAIEFARYVKDALAHFSDTSTYTFLTETEARDMARDTHRQINTWAVDNCKIIGKDAYLYVMKLTQQNASDPFGYFYLMYKIHKTPMKTRPVVSDCASLTHPLGKWVDTMLQPFAQAVPTYFRDSFALKAILARLRVPSGARLFTCDAKSMYTNIDTNIALARISAYLRLDSTKQQFTHYDPEALIAALEIVMRKNIFRFGDLYLTQIMGTAMGIPCAPSWATLFQGIEERDTILPNFTQQLLIFLRYIDDVIGIWIPNPSGRDFNDLIHSMNVGCLEWEFTDLSTSVDFMDMTISIVDESIKTDLYEKPMALYLFIPPHSAHPPGITAGHINGEVLRIHRLCSEEEDVTKRVCTFFRRLTRRGHYPSTLLPLFKKALTNARKFMATSDASRLLAKEAKTEEARRRVYLHREYHPQGPPSRSVQQLFEEHVLRPPGETPFNQLGRGIPLDAMVVANHRAPNLGNILSYRRICKHNRPPASSFL